MAGPTLTPILRISNEQIDLLGRRIAYWGSSGVGLHDNPAAFQVTPTTFSITLTAQRILVANARRRAVLFFPKSGGTFWLWVDSSVAVDRGILVPVSGTPLQFTFGDWGPLVTGEFWGIGSGAGGNINILELLYLL